MSFFLSDLGAVFRCTDLPVVRLIEHPVTCIIVHMGICRHFQLIHAEGIIHISGGYNAHIPGVCLSVKAIAYGCFITLLVLYAAKAHIVRTVLRNQNLIGHAGIGHETGYFINRACCSEIQRDTGIALLQECVGGVISVNARGGVHAILRSDCPGSSRFRFLCFAQQIALCVVNFHFRKTHIAVSPFAVVPANLQVPVGSADRERNSVTLVGYRNQRIGESLAPQLGPLGAVCGTEYRECGIALS